MKSWTPASVDAVKQIVAHDLSQCDADQLAAFAKFAVPPFAAAIHRYGKLESVVVVARRGNELIYWEDVDEGFNVSPMAADGSVLEHWCNQDDLGVALNRWIPGRPKSCNVGPARPLNE